MIPLTTVIAIGGKNAVVKVAVALYCQAFMQGRRRKIISYPEWRAVLGVSKRAYFRAIAALEERKLIRRERKGVGYKATIELLGALAVFPPRRKQQTPRQSQQSEVKVVATDNGVCDHLSASHERDRSDVSLESEQNPSICDD